ncbi:entericidin A/B family lipoprotein [Aquabacterium sp.]
MKRVALFVVLLSALTAALSACNTVHGLGQDIEKAGTAIENAAKK